MPSSSRPKSSKPSRYASTSSSESDLSSGSYRRSMDSIPVAHVAVLRCLRCARTEEATTTDDAAAYGMVRVGQGIYYCKRCAKLVGYK